jgi:hypothetical protein
LPKDLLPVEGLSGIASAAESSGIADLMRRSIFMSPAPAGILTIVLLSAITSGLPARAADPCDGFTWNVAQERALFAASPHAQTAGSDAGHAPAVATGRLYELTLVAQDQVHFATPPGKSDLHKDAYGGLVRFRVPADGVYRVSIDQPVWVDAVADGKLVQSKDFRGQRGCSAPHKVVEFVLPGKQDLLLQFSNAANRQVRVTVTPSAPTKSS